MPIFGNCSDRYVGLAGNTAMSTGHMQHLGLTGNDVHSYAEMAKTAYMDAESIRRAHGDLAIVEEVDHSRVQVALIHEPDKNIQWLAIRGTSNPRNVIVDGSIKIIKDPDLGIYLHGGFLRATREVLDVVYKRLEKKFELRVTGHSLGGAMALILAALLREKGGYQLGCTVTFGQPMVTDSNGVKVLSKHPLLRVVNHWDPVPMLPLILSRTHFEFPPTIFYHHVGPELTLYKSQQPKYSVPGKLIRFAFGYKRLIVNHYIDLYLQRIKAYLIQRDIESWPTSTGT